MAAITKDMSFDSNGKKKREGKVGADVAELNGLMSRHRITTNKDHPGIKKEEKEPARAGPERDGAIPEADPAKIERDGRQQFTRADDRMYQRMFQIESMKNARPAKPFSTGNPIEFTFHMASFEAATNQSTITSQDKLFEIIHWFEGDPMKIIMYHRTNPKNTPDIAFELVKEELDKLFGADVHTVLAMMNTITSGEQLVDNDYHGHLKLYAELREIQAIANCTDSVREINHDTFVIKIFRTRLSHLVEQFCENQMERQEERGKFDKRDFYNFDDLMEEIKLWLSIFRAMNPEDTI